MARVVYRSLTPKKPMTAARSKSRLTVKRVHSSKGRFEVVSLDADSPTFGSDLQYRFERTVAKARRENKLKFGSPDRVRAKK